MLPIIMNALRPYATYLTFPVALVFGFVGYHVEGWLSDKYTPATKSIQSQRIERQLEESKAEQLVEFSSLKDKKFVPATIFERNLSPTLVDDIRHEGKTKD